MNNDNLNKSSFICTVKVCDEHSRSFKNRVTNSDALPNPIIEKFCCNFNLCKSVAVRVLYVQCQNKTGMNRQTAVVKRKSIAMNLVAGDYACAHHYIEIDNERFECQLTPLDVRNANNCSVIKCNGLALQLLVDHQ